MASETFEVVRIREKFLELRSSFWIIVSRDVRNAKKDASQILGLTFP